MEMARAYGPQEWIVNLFHTVDSMDAAGLTEAFTEDGSFRLGNIPAVAGTQQLQEFFQSFFSSIGGLSHRITGVWSGTWQMGKVHSVELEVVYTRKDGTQTDPLPATSTLRMNGHRIRDYRVFIDPSPLFAAPA